MSDATGGAYGAAFDRITLGDDPTVLVVLSYAALEKAFSAGVDREYASCLSKNSPPFPPPRTELNPDLQYQTCTRSHSTRTQPVARSSRILISATSNTSLAHLRAFPGR